MRQNRRISDEDLAAYLDNMLSEQDSLEIEEIVDLDTIEILSVSRKAMDELEPDNVIEFPSWGEASVPSAFGNKSRPLAMAGFLGEDNMCEDALECPEPEE